MHWDWETIPQYMDSLDRAPKGVNCIQYMPTASLMTYVMGLEAAKTRVATEKERAEMARLLDEGMDAGLCGFSIQRLGKDSVQADFDGSPMVTDTMCDEDIFNLARVLRARDEGFMEITQGTGDARRDLAFRRAAGRHRAAPDPLSGGRPDPHRSRDPSPQSALDRAMPRQGSSDLRPGRDRPQRFRLHARTLEPVRRQPGMARAHDRHHRRKDRQDAGSRTARRPCSARPKRPTADSRRSKPASAVRPSI